MILKFDSIRNRHLRRALEHSGFIVILLALIPGLFYFELCYVLPFLIEAYTLPYYIHLTCAIYLLLNIVGNLIYGAFTDTSIRGRYITETNPDKAGDSNWSICSVCECLQPPRAWHCDNCNICILKRDHHCTFFACCVGYYNHRYFMWFTFYVCIAMTYAFYYNIQFLVQNISWNQGFVILKFLFPLVGICIDFSSESTYIFILIINFIVGAFTGVLFFYHLNNVLKGNTVYETKQSANKEYNKGWKLNLVEVFGSRWYLTWILPFVHSPLPANGMEWQHGDKHK